MTSKRADHLGPSETLRSFVENMWLKDLDVGLGPVLMLACVEIGYKRVLRFRDLNLPNLPRPGYALVQGCRVVI